MMKTCNVMMEELTNASRALRQARDTYVTVASGDDIVRVTGAMIKDHALNAASLAAVVAKAYSVALASLGAVAFAADHRTPDTIENENGETLLFPLENLAHEVINMCFYCLGGRQ